jgi:hypothetical protein
MVKILICGTPMFKIVTDRDLNKLDKSVNSLSLFDIKIIDRLYSSEIFNSGCGQVESFYEGIA